jgi:hypothetical protein
LSRPVAVDGKPKLDDVKANVLVEGVEDHLGISNVEPGPVDEE